MKTNRLYFILTIREASSPFLKFISTHIKKLLYHLIFFKKISFSPHCAPPSMVIYFLY